MRKLYLILLILCLSLIVAACASSIQQNKNSVKSNSSNDNIVKLVDANEEIQSLYTNRCLNCHAIDLSGEMGQATNLQRVHERLSYDDIINVISNGREIMPSFKERLTEDEIKALAGWLSKQ